MVIVSRPLVVRDSVNYVEYLTSDGTPYIILDYKPNQNTRIVCDCQATKIISANFPFGTRTGPKNRAFDAALCSNTTRVFYDYGGAYLFVDRTNGLERMTIDANKNVATFTGTETTTVTLAAATFTCQHNLVLFALNENGKILNGDNGWKGKVWSYLIYENDVLLYDLRPAYDQDGVACMYDRVNRVYHYAETGEFIAGEDASDTATVTITGSGLYGTAVKASVTNPVGTVYTSAGVISVEVGSTLTLTVYAPGAWIKVDGATVAETLAAASASYEYTVTGDATITLTNSSTYGTITVTTS